MNILKKPTTWDDTDLIQLELSVFLIGIVVGSIIFHIAKPLMIFILLIAVVLAIKPIIAYSQGEWLPKKQKMTGQQSSAASAQKPKPSLGSFFALKKKQPVQEKVQGSVDSFLAEEESKLQPSTPPPPKNKF